MPRQIIEKRLAVLAVIGVIALHGGGAAWAQEAAEVAPANDAAVWLDRAGEALAQIATDDEAYTLADGALFLLKLEAAKGRAAQTKKVFGQLQMAATKIALTDGDAWASCYLPAGHLLSGNPAEAERAAERLAFDPTIQLDAWQIMAEAASAVDDDQRYAAYTDKMLALFPQVIAQGVKDAADNGHAYDGTYSAWFAAQAMRQHEDLVNLERLATVGLVEPMEQAGVLGVLAQMQWRAGDAEAARASLDEGKLLALRANGGKLAAPDDVWPDAITNVPELAAALWLLDGQDAALALGEMLTKPYVDEGIDWQAAAALHAAAGMRITGDADRAAEALTFALETLDYEPEGASFDVNAATRELVLQDRRKEAIAIAEADGPPNFRAFALMGLAQGMIELGERAP